MMMKKTVLAALFLLLHGIAVAAPVAMVTDVQGGASLGGQPMTLLMELDAGAEIELAADSQLKLVFFSSGKEFLLQGGTLARLTEDAVELDGQPMTGEDLLLSAEGAKLSSAQLSQAAILMRSAVKPDQPVELIFPVASNILEPRPVFSWRVHGDSEKAYKYHLEILSAKGKPLYSGNTDIGRFRLPKDVALPKGERLTWELEARKGDEMVFATADFSIATDDQVDRVDQLSTRLQNDFGRRVMFARYLEANGFRHDANNYWRTLSEERPDLDVLRAKLP